MKLSLLLPKKSLSKAFLKQRPLRSEINIFKSNLLKLIGKIDEIEREENQKNHIRDFLRDTYYKENYEVNTKDDKDLVIHTGKTKNESVGVIIEAKRPGNKSEMISGGKLNCKAFQELVLYYMHERADEKNIDVKYCIVTNIFEWYIFDASVFEKYFYRNKEFLKKYEEWRHGQKVTRDTALFYNDIAKPFIDSIDDEIQAVHFDIRDYEEILKSVNAEDDKEKTLISLYKLFSPHHLLRVSFADDSNKLDESFYKELLHIIGLEEVKEGSKHVIRRKEKDKRDAGSLLENAISKLSILDSADRVSDKDNYGDTKDEKNFNIALELCITWINRILFLKLLEAQLVNYHSGLPHYKFLKPEFLKDFDEVFSLFHHVLAVPESERDKDVRKKFEFVPYLNSTLFEVSPLEKESINISSLNDSLSLEILNNTILKGDKKTNKSLPTLEYILKFLDAYDFSSEGTEDIQESNRTLINASVLGKVFEKINGYKDGSIFTPGFITMYMCREAIRPAVVQKFRDKYNWKADSFDDLRNFMMDKKSAEDVREFNETVNSLKICDPAVGSGHFLVSSLNEIIAIKSELGIFADEYGMRIPDYDISVEQDELIITDRQGDFFEYKIYPSASGDGFRVRGETQRLQRTLFHEKQKIIENCLFGVDINPNSVKICRLRLWIELLKNAYYKPPAGAHHSREGGISGDLETLPNIDINIKTGNSLISRFPLDANLSKFGKRIADTIEEYKINVREYKNEKDRTKKNNIDRIIDTMKKDIRTTFSENDPKLVRMMKLKGELENLETQTGLFEQSKKEQKDQAVKKKKLTAELAKVRKEVDDIRSNAIYRNAFEWRFEFPEVLDGEGEFVGFDVVIGNPPYGVSINRKSNPEYSSLYFDILKGELETYILFYYKGLNILNSIGVLSFITPDSWFTNKNASHYRNWLQEKFQIADVFDFYKPFADAKDTRCHSVLITKKINLEFVKVKQVLPSSPSLIYRKYQVPQEIIKKFRGDEWRFYVTNEERKIFTKMENNSKTLETIYFMKYGMRTGDNKKYITESLTNYPLIAGSDIKKPYELQWKPKYLITKEGLPSGYFNEYFTKEKIIIQRIRTNSLNLKARWLECAFVQGNYIPLDSLSYAYKKDDEHELKFLLSILNSFLMNRYYRAYYTDVNVKPTYLSQLPIPDISKNRQKSLIDLVDEIIESIRQGKNTTVLEDQIDKMVYELYGLTEEEISVVEGSK